MLFDVEKAVMDYITENMDKLVGSGNVTVGVYRRKFPDNAKAVGVTVFSELPGNMNIRGLFPTAIRYTTRHINTKDAWTMMVNLDKMFDDVSHMDLTDTVELCLSNRNAGPDRFEGENDGLHYFTSLFSSIFRYRGDD